MNTTITFDFTDSAEKRTPEDFETGDRPIPVSPFPDVGDFICLPHAGKVYEFRVIRRQFNYLPDGGLNLVVQVD